MVVIEGAVGTESLVSYLIEQYTLQEEYNAHNECESCSDDAHLSSSPRVKRARFSSDQVEDRSSSNNSSGDLASITMPIALNDTYASLLRQCIPSNFYTSSVELNASWAVEKMRISSDTFVNVRLAIQHAAHDLTLIQNEAMYPWTPENGSQDLYTALARAASCGAVECPRICIHYFHHPANTQSTHFVELRTTVAINRHHSTHTAYLFALINELYPCTRKAPSDTGIDAFFRHLQPQVSKQYVAQCQSQLLVPKLAPFQSQNVKWMLRREGHAFVDKSGTVGPLHSGDDDDLPLFWESIRFKSDSPIYINRISQQYTLVRPHPVLDEALAQSHRGGILADEMGLGKTVCVIALVLLHKLTVQDPLHPKLGRRDGLKTTGATLIITPSAILHQWVSELSLHAPALRVFIYRGIKQSKGATVHTAESLSNYDVVLTDYKVLQEECHHSSMPSDRPRRHSTKYVHQRTPLVELLWFRVILDEAQMVESKFANLVVRMAMSIPHWYAWGVTGTPIKSNFEDLFGLCRFLSLAPCISKYSQFQSLLVPGSPLKGLFWDFSKQIMRRNTKATLMDQIHIPTQHRRIVNVVFSPIEQHYYQSQWEQCARATNFQMLDRRRWTAPEASELDSTNDDHPQVIYAKLRSWLLTLRQACVHPAIGGANKLRVLHQTVRTLDEVLYALINQSKDEIESLSYHVAELRIRRGGMHELLKNLDVARRVYADESIPYILNVLARIEERFKDSRNKADEEEKKHSHQQHDDEHDGEAEGMGTVARAKGGDEGRYRSLIKRRLRLQMCLHQCYFFLAGIYHEMGEADQESENYNNAAAVRRDILSRAEEKVKLGRKDVLSPLEPIELKMAPSSQKEILHLDSDILDRINTVARILNEQLVFIRLCRAALHVLLRSNLVDHSENEATGDEYEQSLLLQEKIDLYRSVYQALLSDRAFLINGTWVVGLRHDIDEQQKEADILANSDASCSPGREFKRLKTELWTARKKFAPQSEQDDNIRGISSELREIVVKPVVNNVEKHIISSEIYRLNAAVSKQREMQESLETEYRRFLSLYNHRIEYYKFLQQISDDVVAWESSDPEGEIETLLVSEIEQENLIKEKSARCRYLENIAMEKSQSDEKPRRCLICLSDFTKGLMTFCGHMYCKDCATLWFRSHQRCPQCNTSVMLQECYAIAWDKSAKAITINKPKPTIANEEQLISPSLLREINKQEIEGGLGAKLDSIIRHIKYIIHHTGGKSVVFSQWKDVLDLIAGGLKKNGIMSIQLNGLVRDDRIKRFRDDPNTHVILLHARSQSSGLTLVSAQTVFIVEPLLNESFERQAISRVHRIGQTKETTVYWYIVQDTIEERIHAIHNAQRQRRMDSEGERSDELETLSESDLALATRSEGGGEHVSDADLQRCFTSDESWALGLVQTSVDGA